MTERSFCDISFFGEILQVFRCLFSICRADLCLKFQSVETIYKTPVVRFPTVIPLNLSGKVTYVNNALRAFTVAFDQRPVMNGSQGHVTIRALKRNKDGSMEPIVMPLVNDFVALKGELSLVKEGLVSVCVEQIDFSSEVESPTTVATL